MVHIEEDKMTIVVEGTFMHEAYADLVVQIIDLLAHQDPEVNIPSSHYNQVSNLLAALMPNVDQAKRMD